MLYYVDPFTNWNCKILNMKSELSTRRMTRGQLKVAVQCEDFPAYELWECDYLTESGDF